MFLVAPLNDRFRTPSKFIAHAIIAANNSPGVAYVGTCASSQISPLWNEATMLLELLLRRSTAIRLTTWWLGISIPLLWEMIAQVPRCFGKRVNCGRPRATIGLRGSGSPYLTGLGWGFHYWRVEVSPIPPPWWRPLGGDLSVGITVYLLGSSIRGGLENDFESAMHQRETVAVWIIEGLFDGQLDR